LLLVRRVCPFLVTSNGRIYRRFGAGHEATRRLDDVEARSWRAAPRYANCASLAFVFILFFRSFFLSFSLLFIFFPATWMFRIVDAREEEKSRGVNYLERDHGTLSVAMYRNALNSRAIYLELQITLRFTIRLVIVYE